MSSSRYLPKCTCQQSDGQDFEVRSLSAMAGGLATMSMQCRTLGLCLDSERYVSISAIACLVVGMSSVSMTVSDLLAGKRPSIDEAEFERVLETLAEEVRLRRAEMEAFNEQFTTGGTRQ